MDTDNKHINILFVGGGTGGHFFPLISIAEALNASPNRLTLYYAGPEPYNLAALETENIHFVRVFAGKLRRYFSILNFLDLFKTLIGSLGALIKLFIIYPDVVVSKGSYTSVPIVFAAKFLRIPIIVHESDSVIGRANKLGVRFARHIIVSYEETESVLAGRSVFRFGIPIRKALLAPKNTEGTTTLNIRTDRPILFVTGGSQGAKRVNELILDSLDELLTDFTVVHQTGELDFELCKLSADTLITNQDNKQYYLPTAFLDATTLNEVYHLSSMVVSRAGSTSIYEIALHGKPSILIPIPETISHDQRSNAYAYARTGAATVLEEENISDSLLRAEIDRIMQNPELYSDMAGKALAFAMPHSAEKIAALILEVAKEH